ncbi:MAG: hypothetical protein O0X96_07900 [Methanocorpusculum sp.]|nr:hypothetical protein [Methanocorpusculum sp.]MDE2525029.1 hypothetical protein [Methanocorpusculum sp.]
MRMIITMNQPIGTIDLPTTLTSSAGTHITVGQVTTITYQGVSPKIMTDETEMSEITLWLNDELLRSARTCSRVRGAYFDSTYAFVPQESGVYIFSMRGGYKYLPWTELEIIAELIVRVV